MTVCLCLPVFSSMLATCFSRQEEGQLVNRKKFAKFGSFLIINSPIRSHFQTLNTIYKLIGEVLVKEERY